MHRNSVGQVSHTEACVSIFDNPEFYEWLKPKLPQAVAASIMYTCITGSR